jgi:hypothetical protein
MTEQQTKAGAPFTPDAPISPGMDDTWWRITTASVDGKAKKPDNFIGVWAGGGGRGGYGSPLRYLGRQIIWS